MTTSWLHALLGITHNAKHHKKVCENKETDSSSGIYRMKLPGTCSLSKENEVTGNMLTIKGELSNREHAHYQRRVMGKKNGTPILGDSYFLAGTPTFYKKGVPDSYFLSPSENPEASAGLMVYLLSEYYFLC